MKNKMNIKRRILSLCLACLMVFELAAAREIALAASPITWNNTSTVSLGNNSYYKITDMGLYGLNYTGYSNLGYSYNIFFSENSGRVTYFKKVAVTSGQKLSFVTSEGDITSGSANTVSSRNIWYAPVEFDANGNVVFDGNWNSLNTVWTVGQSTNGATVGTRSNVAYVIFVFKWADGVTGSSGTGGNITASQIVNEVKNLYIVKGTLKYNLSYNAYGGSVSPVSKTITYGSTYGTLPTPTRTGYTFNGWYTAASGGSKVIASTAMNRAANHTLYARWTRNNYTVTYNANGGSTPNHTQNYYYNSSVDLSPVAEKAGKIFIGWSTDSNATKAMESFAMPDCSVTLYAVYTIPVSDVANHTYPDYEQVKEEEVYFRVWEIGNEENIRVYPLEYTRDILTMKYRYVLPSADISDFVSGMADYGYEILAYDNAGNYTTIYKSDPPPPPPVKYWQTVNHYKYDKLLDYWIKFYETTEYVLEGLNYTPAYTTPPEGYRTSHIDGGYLVDDAKTSNAYYVPIDYTLTFDSNGGSCDVTEKIITYNDYYGELPVPTREGYEFIGWYTDGGTEVKSSHKYQTPDNTTVYAHWQIMDFTVTYDYWTNGGASTDTEFASVEYAAAIDLSVKAYKDGWDFVGWNTDSRATSGLTSMNMPVKDVTLYAIYKKDIKLTLIEQTDSGQVARSETKTIYNTEKEAVFPMTEENTWTGWTFLGWSDSMLATDYPVVGIGNEYRISESDTIYGLYMSTITLSYDTNGSSMVIEDLKKDGYYNASGHAAYPEFIIKEAPVLLQHSFVEWNIESGTVLDETGQALTTCNPEEKVIISSDTVLKTIWNKHPEIEAYDRHFTLEQANAGEITETELLKKVTATDLEDGTLINGVDVIVKDYNANDFISLETDKEIQITYQATDSFGNVVTRTITVNVTDTSIRERKKKRYVRFISMEYFEDKNGNLLPASEGGIEETSIWRTNEKLRTLLRLALSKT